MNRSHLAANLHGLAKRLGARRNDKVLLEGQTVAGVRAPYWLIDRSAGWLSVWLCDWEYMCTCTHTRHTVGKTGGHDSWKDRQNVWISSRNLRVQKLWVWPRHLHPPHPPHGGETTLEGGGSLLHAIEWPWTSMLIHEMGQSRFGPCALTH